MRLPRAGKGDGVASRLWVTAAGIFFGLFLILSAIIWSGERASNDRRKAELREIHTQTVLLEAQHLLSALQDTEAAERGYVITARPGFLEPYERGRKEVAASLDRLAEMSLIQSNPADAYPRVGPHHRGEDRRTFRNRCSRAGRQSAGCGRHHHVGERNEPDRGGSVHHRRGNC